MKFRKFLKTVPMKIYLILLATVLFSFFSNDFGLVDIQKTAIILAAGIDKAEDGFSVTAQIAVPKGSERTTGGTSSVEIEGEGKTVSDCVSNIFAKTGWVPKLVFCNLIVLGEDAVKENVIAYLNYFLRSDYMSDSCLLAVCEGRAGELISSQSAIDDVSSLAIEQLFSDAAVKSGKVVTNTLKDFAIGYYGVSKSGYLPFIRQTAQERVQSGGDDDDVQGWQEPHKIYSAEETALFSEGKMVGLLPREQTLAFSLLQGNVFAGTVNAEEKGKPVTLNVIKNEGGVSLEVKESPRVKLSLDVVLRLCCRSVTADIGDIASDKVSPEIIESTKSNLTRYIGELWESCKTSGCDLFCLKRTLYRSSLKKFAVWKDSLLATAQADISADVRSMK